jgi:hypothetical protein
MPLTADREVKFYSSLELVELGLEDNVKIYKGAFVGRNPATDYVRALVAADDFVGVAYAQADNTIAGHVAGGVKVKLHQNVDIVHAMTATIDDVGKVVYANGDSTLTFTGVGNSRVGRLVAIEGTNLVRVRLQPVFELT